MKIPIGQYLLRDWEWRDEAAIVKYADNPKIACNLRDGFPSPYTRDDARQFLSSVMASTPRTAFAIATAAEAIGGIGLLPGRDVHRFTAELGYWLAEPYWGRGIMSAAVITMCEVAFKAFGLNRVSAEPYASNGASIRVLEKAGFQYEGRLRASVVKHGKVLDQVIYAKIRVGDR